MGLVRSGGGSTGGDWSQVGCSVGWDQACGSFDWILFGGSIGKGCGFHKRFEVHSPLLGLFLSLLWGFA